MKEQIIEVRDYVTKSNLPASDYVINPYIGCPHACKYCYACFMKRFTKHSEDWGTFIDVKHCSKPISKKRLEGKNVFLSSVTDCYNPYEKEHCITQSILKQLHGIDCMVTISTKSDLILRDIDLLKRFKNLIVSMSVNTMDENFKNDMDHASSIVDRMNALKVLHENGIYTVLFLSPIFPKITDFKEIIEYSHLFVDEYWFENLNLRGHYKEKILEYIRIKYPQFTELYEQIYLKGQTNFWSKLAYEIEHYCRKRSIKYTNFFYHKQLVEQKKSTKNESQ